MSGSILLYRIPHICRPRRMRTVRETLGRMSKSSFLYQKLMPWVMTAQLGEDNESFQFHSVDNCLSYPGDSPNVIIEQDT